MLFLFGEILQQYKMGVRHGEDFLVRDQTCKNLLTMILFRNMFQMM